MHRNTGQEFPDASNTDTTEDQLEEEEKKKMMMITNIKTTAKALREASLARAVLEALDGQWGGYWIHDQE